MRPMPDYHINALVEAQQRLTASPWVPAAARHLEADAATIDAKLASTVLAEVPAFAASKNPQLLPQLAAHGPLHTREILRLLRGGDVGPFEFVAAHARLRAEQHFPLETTLHAYRCGHKVFAHAIREALLASVPAPRDAQSAIAAAADFAMEYTDAISTLFAGAYVAQARLLADVAGDRRAQLLAILLDGYDESDGRVAKILRAAGYLDRRQSFCVALAEPVDPAEIQNPARARRLAESIDRLLYPLPVRRVVDIRDNKVTVVVSDTRRASGWTAPQSALAERVAAALATVGNAVLVGISNDVPATAQIPRALREASVALELADVSRRVAQFARIPIRELTLHLAGAELQRVLPAWAGDLTRLDVESGGAVVATLRAYAGADMNVLKAAQALAVHPNTIYARFQKIRAATGLNPRAFHPLNELLTVADCAQRRPGVR